MKKQLIYLMLISLFNLFNSKAQTTFQKTISGTNIDYGYSAHQTSDGGYIITGAKYSFATNYDVFLGKTDANGDLLWSKSYGGSFSDYGYEVQQTSDGGYIIAGTTESFGAGEYDIYLIKTDANGDTLWTKAYGGTSFEYGNSLEQTTDGGYIISGATRSFGNGNYDFYLIKTNATGDTLWTKTFGGTHWDWCGTVQQTTDGGYYAVGYANNFGSSSFTCFYQVKLDALGDSLWIKGIAWPGIPRRANAASQTSDGGYIITGSIGGVNTYDVCVTKTDSIGNFVWSKTYGGTGDDEGFDVKQTSDGGYIIAGRTNSFGAGIYDVYLIKTNSIGDTLWTKTFGGTGWEEANSVQQTSDDGYIIAGWTDGFGGPFTDIYLIKTDSNGNSGCNQGNTATIVTTPTTQTAGSSTVVSSGGMVTYPPTNVGTGSTLNTLCVTIGVNEISSVTSLILSPNPSPGTFIISFPTIDKGDIIITNVLGKVILSKKINNELEKEINLKYIPDGIYIVKVFDGEKIFTQKIIVE